MDFMVFAVAEALDKTHLAAEFGDVAFGYAFVDAELPRGPDVFLPSEIGREDIEEALLVGGGKAGRCFSPKSSQKTLVECRMRAAM